MPCRVLGPPGSAEYVVDAGGYLASERETFEVLVIADQEGFPFLETVDGTLSEIFRRIDGGLPLHLVLPNPDLIYPKPSGYGITSGSIALVIEAAIQTRYPDRSDLRFTVLGKPKPDLFLEALGRCGTENVVMIGDQLATDIAGANAAGVDSALLLGGVSSARLISQKSGPQPTYVIASLMPAA
jgi:ribonucleotide monophosphatase NagD (HAD superfamily)